jgi:hypothetical protein
LPQPEGPMMATNSPRATSRSTRRRALTGTPSESKVLRRPRVWRTASAPLTGPPPFGSGTATFPRLGGAVKGAATGTGTVLAGVTHPPRNMPGRTIGPRVAAI